MEGIVQLIGMLIGATVGALIGAVFVRLATRMVAGFTPPFGTSWLAAYLGFAASIIIVFVAGISLGASRGHVDASANILLMVIGFFVQAAIYGSLLKHPESGPIGFGKACLVSIVQLVAAAIIFGIIALIIYAATR